jgi:hypothetical protein
MSEKIYGWLLKLYPARFRTEYGASAMQLFRDRLRAERGVFQRIRFWIDMIVDLAVSIPREHWRPNWARPVVGGYRLSHETVTTMCRREIVAPALFFYFFLALGFTAGWFGNSWRFLLLATYLSLAVLGMNGFRDFRELRKRWLSYELILGPDRIQQKQHGHDLTVLRNEIVTINESQLHLHIIGIREGRPITILVPAGLIGYEKVRDHVSQWMAFSQRRALWLSDPRVVLGGLIALLPAMLLVRSLDWFVPVGAVYYALILLAILVNVVRPPRNSGLTPRRIGWELPPPAYMWRRFKRQCRQPPLLALMFLPIVRAVVAVPH